jgi:hypothetical protein
MARFSSTISIHSLTENVRVQMRRRDASKGVASCLGCGQPVRSHEHAIRAAGGLCHPECALYQRRTA